MALSRTEVESLVVRIQAAFLNAPALCLNAAQAALQFDVAGAVCEAILQALVDARVLAVSAEGEYRRFFPARAQSQAA